MGNGNGIELVEKVAELGEMKPMVAVMSGYTEVTIAELLARGATDLLSKPFDLSLFDQRIRKLLTPVETRWFGSLPSRVDYTHKIPSLEFARVAGGVQFGNGGVFIAATDRFAVGEVICIQIDCSDGLGEPLKFQGLVRWSRLTASKYFHAGMGLEFTSMDMKAITTVKHELKRYPVQCYIPIGDRPAGK